MKCLYIWTMLFGFCFVNTALGGLLGMREDKIDEPEENLDDENGDVANKNFFDQIKKDAYSLYEQLKHQLKENDVEFKRDLGNNVDDNSPKNSNLLIKGTVIDPLRDQFVTFKHRYRKSYDEPEEKKRFQCYKGNKQKIDHRNDQYSHGNRSYMLGINKYGDLEHGEFTSSNRGFKDPGRRRNTTTYSPPANFTSKDVVNWTAQGYVTPVKDQQQCGSCWTFSSTGALEGQNFRKTNQLISLSEQDLLDCSRKYGTEGCDGGFMNDAFSYVKDNGICTGDSYPYKAEEQQSCYAGSEGATCTGFVNIPAGDETKLMQAVAEVGPVACAIYASAYDFQFYKTGVYDDPECKQTPLNHAVLITGYGTTTDGIDYWLVKNSWGTSWGEYGYIKMARNNGNHCGIASIASYPIV